MRLKLRRSDGTVRYQIEIRRNGSEADDGFADASARLVRVCRGEIKVSKGLGALALYHEIGHFAQDTPMREQLEASVVQRIFGGPGPSVVRAEAAAWRWAVKEWTKRRKRPLNCEEQNFIRFAYGTYLEAYRECKKATGAALRRLKKELERLHGLGQ